VVATKVSNYIHYDDEGPKFPLNYSDGMLTIIVQNRKTRILLNNQSTVGVFNNNNLLKICKSDIEMQNAAMLTSLQQT